MVRFTLPFPRVVLVLVLVLLVLLGSPVLVFTAGFLLPASDTLPADRPRPPPLFLPNFPLRVVGSPVRVC